MTETALKLLQIDLTDECPLYCAHCSNSSGPARETFFPIERLMEIVQEAKYLGLERIVYSGGEPLRYPYLEKALNAARIAGIHTTIFTTGIEDKKTRLSISLDRWQTLRRQGVAAARFSIYAGPSHRNFHNNLVQAKPVSGDAFGVNEQAMRDARSTGIEVELHFIPSGATFEDLSEIYSWASGLGCATLHLQIPTYQGRNKHRTSLELSDAGELRLRDLALGLTPVTSGTEFHISRFWLCRWRTSSDLSCVANPEQLIIRTDGTISPCNACKYGNVTYPVENILAFGAGLSTIWRHSRALQEVRTARKEGRLPTRCEGVLATSPKVDIC